MEMRPARPTDRSFSDCWCPCKACQPWNLPASGSTLGYDHGLISLAQESQHVEVQLAEREEALRGLRVDRDSLQSVIGEARGDWEQAADTAGFPGKPTIDLPLRASGESRTPRLE